MNNLIRLVLAAVLVGAILPAAQASAQRGLNLNSSEYRTFNNLPRSGEPEQIPWVGWWWAYTTNGIDKAYRGGLSPSQKYDAAVGNTDNLDLEALDAHIETLRTTVHPLSNARRDVVEQLNRMIARGENYRECSRDDYPEETDACIDDEESRNCACPWRKYRELGTLIERAEAELGSVEVDTATEFERLNHGNGVAGVQGWWGHCNAWAAAAILEPEPVRQAEIDGVTWYVGDVKALLTEVYMTVNSSFYGSRVGENNSSLSRTSEAATRIRELIGIGKDANAAAREVTSEFPDETASEIRAYAEWFAEYNDLTPADFHILFAVYLGQLNRTFVIDRFTGSEVWNQPVSRFDAEVTGELEQVEIDGQTLHPITLRTRFEWATDGVEPDATNESEGSGGFHHRTVSYTLYLDKPLADADARIVGPGVWDHAAMVGDHAHPDFAWAPTSDAPATRRNDGTYYENPHVSADWVRTNLLPHVIAEVTDPGPGGGGETGELTGSSSPAAAIADNATVTDAITLTGDGVIAGTQIAVDIEHTYIGDLEVVVEHGGRRAILHNRSGSGTNDIQRTFTTDDFDGLEAAGEWTISITDNANADTGTLNSWTVTAVVGGGDGGGGGSTGGDAREFAATGVPASIPDDDDTGASVTIDVPDTLAIGSAEIEVDIQHTYIGDLRVVLSHGDIEEVLHDREGGSADDISKVFSLGRFDGSDAAGTWTLRVTDHAGQDTGAIRGATLRLTPDSAE